MALLELHEPGLYCPAGDFFIDPALPVGRAVITHAHADHACAGSQAYLTARPGEALLRERSGGDAAIEALDYGQPTTLGGVRLSLHPAGHILGSAQVRLEQGGEVWVVSGDYKLSPDPTCARFEPLRCHTFVTESTFGLPIFRWPAPADVIAEIESWWRANQEAGKASILFAYALGKAQRVLAAIDPAIGPIHVHEAIDRLNQAYRAQGVSLAPTVSKPEWRSALVIAPPYCNDPVWKRRFGAASTALASGWMRIRGTRRRRSLDRGFVLSDHADWPALLSAIDETRAETVWVTHGSRDPLVRWLEEHGRHAFAVATPLAPASGAEAPS